MLLMFLLTTPALACCPRVRGYILQVNTAKSAQGKLNAIREESTADPPSSGKRSIPHAPEALQTTLVTQFDASPATYSTEDAGVRLHIVVGCLRKGHVAGPIVMKIRETFLVESEGCSYVVSAIVDCQPSGSKFDRPLELDFRVGEELDNQDMGAERSIDVDEHVTGLRDTFKVSLPTSSRCGPRSYLSGGGCTSAPYVVRVPRPTKASPNAHMQIITSERPRSFPCSILGASARGRRRPLEFRREGKHRCHLRMREVFHARTS